MGIGFGLGVAVPSSNIETLHQVYVSFNRKVADPLQE
jgi:hypothetical protein